MAQSKRSKKSPKGNRELKGEIEALSRYVSAMKLELSNDIDALKAKLKRPMTNDGREASHEEANKDLNPATRQAEMEETQWRKRVDNAFELAQAINEDPEFSKPLTTNELTYLHGPLAGKGSVGARAHAEIMRYRKAKAATVLRNNNPEDNYANVLLAVRACRIAFRMIPSTDTSGQREVASRLIDVWEEAGLDMSRLATWDCSNTLNNGADDVMRIVYRERNKLPEETLCDSLECRKWIPKSQEFCSDECRREPWIME